MEHDINAVMSQVKSLNDTVSQLQYEIRNLSDRIAFLESKSKVKHETPARKLSHSEALDCYWHCSPKQHAVIQMIFMHMTTPSIANRLDVSENGAKSQVRYLCNKLHVNTKTEIIANYESIWIETPEDEYFQRTKIPKFWYKKYAHLSYKVAERKDDYFKIICKTNYRMPKYQ